MGHNQAETTLLDQLVLLDFVQFPYISDNGSYTVYLRPVL